jgi:hypothetical protein
MIVEFVINTIVTLVKLIFGWINLPSLPSVITDAFSYVLSMVSDVSGLLHYIFSTPLFIAIVGVVVAVLAFDQLYHLTMWIVRKLPISID